MGARLFSLEYATHRLGLLVVFLSPTGFDVAKKEEESRGHVDLEELANAGVEEALLDAAAGRVESDGAAEGVEGPGHGHGHQASSRPALVLGMIRLTPQALGDLDSKGRCGTSISAVRDTRRILELEKELGTTVYSVAHALPRGATGMETDAVRHLPGDFGRLLVRGW